MKRLVLPLLLSLPFVATHGINAESITPVVEYQSVESWTEDRPFTLGHAFSTTTTFAINALGAWYDGLGNDRRVGLWDSNGSLLVSATVSGSATDIDNFQWAPVIYNLAPGTYTIGAEFLGNWNPFPVFASGVTSLPGYTWITDEQQLGVGLNFPTVALNGSYGDNGFLYADFSVEDLSPVPEPSSFLLLGSGLTAFAEMIRRRLRA